MISSLVCLVSGFLVRLSVVGILLKSSLDIIALNQETPKLIVDRTHHILDFMRDTLSINIDYGVTTRFVMKHQDQLSLGYAGITLFLTVLVLLNRKGFISLLIGHILFSVVFFYVEFQEPYLLNKTKMEDLLAILGIIGGLFVL